MRGDRWLPGLRPGREAVTHLLAVNANNWPFPFGYFYRGVLSNLVASVVAFVTGLVIGRKPWKRLKAHNRWSSQQLANIHLATVGEHAEAHPEHGRLTK